MKNLSLAAAGCCLVAIACAEEAPSRLPILSESGWWRQCCRFGADRVSRDALKREGLQVLGPNGLERLRKQTEDRLRQSGADPATVDWQERVFVRMFFDPDSRGASPPFPAAWMAPEFDDSAWVLERGFFHEPVSSGQPLPKVAGWTKDDLDRTEFSSLGMQACCYRARFVVDEPAKAGDLTLRLVYRGGDRAFLNGKELARGHLPEGAADAPAEDYPRRAYEDQSELRDRVLGPVQIPSALLRQGTNVLAIEVHASRLHPIALSLKLAMHNHKVRQGMVGMWRHCGLLEAELTLPRVSNPREGTEDGVASGLSRPPGVQVWVQDIHHRVESTEFLSAGESAGAVRFVGARNGTFGAQVVVGTDRPLVGLRVKVTDLSLPKVSDLREGTESGPPDNLPKARNLREAVQIFYPAPYPATGFTEAKLGDDRGLGATFPNQALLAQYEKPQDNLPRVSNPREGNDLFDHLASAPPPTIPANTCRPVWLSLRIPADAEPGTYRGAVEVAAEGVPPVPLPLEAEVVGWRLPEPRGFQTFVGCEQNPYGVAKQYGVPLWSEAHWKLVEASFRQLARVGNKWLNVPVLSRTEFGNRDDSMIRWRRGKDGALAFDYALLDRYLELAIQHCGTPRVVNFAVMQGMKSAATPPVQPSVQVLDEGSGKASPLALNGIPAGEKERIWEAFATSLRDHMKARGLDKAMYWGYPLEQEDDPELKLLLDRCTPGVFWAADPHELLWNAVYGKDPHYKALVTVRHMPGARSFPGFRMDRGWKSPMIHLLNPRTGGNFFALHTTSYPFAYRAVVDQAVTRGHNGLSRIGADEWAAIHYSDMAVPKWLTGMPVLFLLWPGREGAESSIRFETLLEGTQEVEARIFLEQALDGGKLPAGLAKQVTQILAEHLQATSFLQGTLCIHELEKYHAGWQERSRRLYRAAAETASALGSPPQK